MIKPGESKINAEFSINQFLFVNNNAKGESGMKKTHLIYLVIGLLFFSSGVSLASEKVTVDNYVRAETDMTLARYVKTGALGKFLHIRQPTPIDEQNVIRMNRDTIYSIGVFDLTEPVTIVKPDSKGRFQSMQVINQDHYTLTVDTIRANIPLQKTRSERVTFAFSSGRLLMPMIRLT